MALYTASQVQLVRCPCIRNGLLPFQHDGLWSRASHARRELVRAVGLHPLPKWSHCTEAGSKRYTNIIGQRNGVWPPACVISSSGRTSRPGDPAVPLAVHKGEVPPTAPYGVRPERTGTPGCRAGMRSLRSDQPRARTAYCAVGVYPAVRTPTITSYDWR